jgi:hypothetical protein
VFGIALGYEDLNDHDELRHDPMMAILAGKLTARREDCAPVAGKSTLNRLELSKLAPTRYHKISHNPMAIKNLLVDLFVEAHERAPRQIILDLDATDDPLHGEQEGRLFHAYYDCHSYLPLYVFCGRHPLWPPHQGGTVRTNKSSSLPLGTQFRNIFKLFQNRFATSGRDCSSVPRAAAHKYSGRVRGLASGLGGTGDQSL